MDKHPIVRLDSLITKEGTALSLSTKGKLENPGLGSECYIGSDAKPVTFNVTTGKPIKGTVGNLELIEERADHRTGRSRF
jgi:hypothetical protein